MKNVSEIGWLGQQSFRDLADRVYTSQLIGKIPDLVMHGGGNTSCKTFTQNLFGEKIDVLCVKGSGWDLGTIKAAGLPALTLEPLVKLRQLSKLSDEDMVNLQRANLLDSSSPNPSVETLLHAFLPYKFIDHTHSTPFLALANLPDPNGRYARDFFWCSFCHGALCDAGFRSCKNGGQGTRRHATH